jgi:hypothetical protein
MYRACASAAESQRFSGRVLLANCVHSARVGLGASLDDAEPQITQLSQKNRRHATVTAIKRTLAAPYPHI